MKTPKTPPPPDPVATANAQTAMNVKTATNQQQLNMVDQYTPEGSLKYTQIGTWADGTPKYQVNQAYSPEQQRLYETNVATDQNLANLAKSQSGFLNEYMDRPVDLSAEAVSARQSSMGMPASVQWEGNIKPTTTAGSWNAERINPIAIGSNENLAQSLFDSAARRMGNTVERDYDNMQSKLAARGIKPGSAAWDRAQNVFDERINDQYNQLYVAAQDQAFNQAAQRSQIGFNQALTGQGQYFDQTLAGQQQQFAQDLSAQNTNFNNALQAQTTAYDQAMAARQQAIQELASSTAPLPPSPKWLHTATRAPAAAAMRAITSCSDLWSVGNELIATTGVTPWALTFSICLRRFSPPISTSAGFSASSSGGRALPATILYLPECAFSARTVVTSTAASGTRPEARHLMLKKRSAPMSAPKPASVMR